MLGVNYVSNTLVCPPGGQLVFKQAIKELGGPKLGVSSRAAL